MKGATFQISVVDHKVIVSSGGSYAAFTPADARRFAQELSDAAGRAEVTTAKPSATGGQQ